MIKILASLFFILSFNVNAGLISFDSENIDYQIGDPISVEIRVNNTSSDIAEVELELIFNHTLVDFVDFEFDPITTQFAMITDNNLIGTNTLNIYSIWFDNHDVPSGQIKLGTANFIARSDINKNQSLFELDPIFVGDSAGNPIADMTQVPEPNSVLIMLSGLCLIAGVRSKRSLTS